MKLTTCIGLAALLALGAAPSFAQSDVPTCRLLDQTAALRFVPDKVPLEMESIPVDTKNIAALVFPNKARAAIVPLLTSGYSADIREKYQYVFVTETRLRFDRWSVPSGMVGLGFEPSPDREAPVRYLVARDFSGAEIDRIPMKLDNSSPAVPVSLTPKGEKEFELRLGRYVIQGTQR